MNDNIVVVPPRIWSAFTSWYGTTIEIQRTVIKYKSDGKRREILPSYGNIVPVKTVAGSANIMEVQGKRFNLIS